MPYAIKKSSNSKYLKVVNTASKRVLAKQTSPTKARKMLVLLNRVKEKRKVVKTKTPCKSCMTRK